MDRIEHEERESMSLRVSDQIATAFALSAFSLAILNGLFSGVEASQILTRAVVVLIATYALGGVLGRVAAVALREHANAMMHKHPIPEPIVIPKPGSHDDGEVGEVEIIDDVDES